MTFTATDRPVAETHTWLTPKPIIDALGPFDMDPCAAPEPRPFDTAKIMNSESDANGLEIPWAGRVWLNPPYGTQAEQWLSKLEQHGDGIALVFARLDTNWLQNILSRHGFFALRGRIRFLRPDGSTASNSAGAGSILIPFGQYNISRVINSGLRGLWKV